MSKTSDITSKKAALDSKTWLAAVIAICCTELLLNAISFVSSAEYSFSWKVSLARIVLMLAAFALYRIFRSKSALWTIPLDTRSSKQRALIVLVVAAMCLSIVPLSRISGQTEWLERGAVYEDGIAATQDGNQYNYLADSFLAGRVWLDLPVSDVLLNMENPYDTPLRQQLNSTVQDDIYWDYAFHDGRYYCYFGALPCLVTFVPYKALTGLDLRTDYVVVLFAWLALISGVCLLFQLARCYFKRMRLLAFLLAVFLWYGASGILEQAFLPRIYPIPILSSLFFSCAGFAVLVRARRHFDNDGTAPKSLLALGGLSIALTLGCRPQFVIAALLIVPLFWPQIKNRLFFSAKGLPNTLCIMVPFLLVALPVCWYNYARFESITDFGASYNLTGADMTSYSFDPAIIALRMIEYLFLPPCVTSAFPFIQAINQVPSLPAILWTNEPFYGGYFCFAPATLTVFALLSKRTREKLQDCGVFWLAFGMCVTAIIVLVVICYVSGVTMRYFADFSWLIIIPTTFILWTILDVDDSGPRRGFTSLFVLIGIPLYCWTFFGTARFGALVNSSPWLVNAAEAALRFM